MKQALAGVVTLSPRPNYLESWPVKTFEYMHASLPVVASNFPFWKKLLTPHQCAVFVDPTNPERIAEGLCWILENPKTARAMGARGRCAALRYYLWKDQSKVLLREYHKIEQKIKKEKDEKPGKSNSGCIRIGAVVLPQVLTNSFLVYLAAFIGFVLGACRDILIISQAGDSKKIFDLLYVSGISSLICVNTITFSRNYPDPSKILTFCIIGVALSSGFGWWIFRQPFEIGLCITITLLWIMGGLYSKRLLLRLRMFSSRIREALASGITSLCILLGFTGKLSIVIGVIGGTLFAFFKSQEKKLATDQQENENKKSKHKVLVKDIILINCSTLIILLWALQINNSDETLLGHRIGNWARISMYLYQLIVIGSVAFIPFLSTIKKGSRNGLFLSIALCLLAVSVFLQNKISLLVVPTLAVFVHIFAIQRTLSFPKQQAAPNITN